MTERITKEELWQLRNEMKIDQLIKLFAIPWKSRSGRIRFLCPICGGFHTATNPKTNLARCFDCARNLNPIDLTMREKECSFLEAVEYLREVLKQRRLKNDHRLS